MTREKRAQVAFCVWQMISTKDGERGRNRTYNLLIKSQLLCQLSYAPVRGKVLAGQFVIVTFLAGVVIAAARFGVIVARARSWVQARAGQRAFAERRPEARTREMF
jgi:hypothetical protein